MVQGLGFRAANGSGLRLPELVFKKSISVRSSLRP